jgi:hypothetical protein
VYSSPSSVDVERESFSWTFQGNEKKALNDDSVFKAQPAGRRGSNGSYSG